jgi:WD40 repeat protein
VLGGQLLQEGRLEALLEQALAAQAARCRSHNVPRSAPPPSLLRDHSCALGSLPSACVQVAAGAHSDEVWHLAWSADGQRLASGGRDCAVLLWMLEVPQGTLQVGRPPQLTRSGTLGGHGGPVSFLAWAPDGARLLSCSADRSVRLWDVHAEAPLRLMRKHADAQLSAAWLPCSQRFYTAGGGRLILWAAPAEGDGATAAPIGSSPPAPVELSEQRLPRAGDIALSADGRVLAAQCAERRVRLSSPRQAGLPVAGEGAGAAAAVVTDERHVRVAESAITSLSLSRDGRTLLLCLQSQELQLWDCARSPPAVAPRLRLVPPGARTGRYVVRAVFGGAGDAFVASGSEDALVHIWGAHTGELLASLDGHGGVVNAVAWNPAHPGVLASASDDATVRLWAATASDLPPQAAGEECRHAALFAAFNGPGAELTPPPPHGT